MRSIIALAVAQLADVGTTFRDLTTGVGAESNPVTRFILDSGGYGAWILSKAAIVILGILILRYTLKVGVAKVGHIFLFGCTALVFTVAAHNVLVGL